MVAGALATLFANDDKDLVATRVPNNDGALDEPNEPNVSTFDAFFGILSNAFIESI